MSRGNGIAWCTSPDGSPGFSWSPVVGCTAVSPGCANCWAAAMASRGLCSAHRGLARGGHWIPGAGPRFLPKALSVPLRRRKPTGYAVCLMGDLFHERVTDEQIARVFCTMGQTAKHRFYVLTKRADRMARWFSRVGSWEGFWTHNGQPPAAYAGSGAVVGQAVWPLPNVWLGVSVEDQKTADERIPHLLRCPAAVRWVSAEPLIEAVDLCLLDDYIGDPDVAIQPCHSGRLHWVVVGGESGPRARPCDLAWVRSIRDQCRAAGAAFFCKQLPGRNGKVLSDPALFPEDLRIREFPNPSA